jgi:hypothetical protein
VSGAKANAVRPHEPAVTVSQSPGHYFEFMVTGVSETSVIVNLSFCHYDVHSDINC